MYLEEYVIETCNKIKHYTPQMLKIITTPEYSHHHFMQYESLLSY
jgi:hypothetical protein